MRKWEVSTMEFDSGGYIHKQRMYYFGKNTSSYVFKDSESVKFQIWIDGKFAFFVNRLSTAKSIIQAYIFDKSQFKIKPY